ncbi:MAG: hypothetical protein PHE59_05410 [Patescibacteria group bacterium]|nr:hypothetical protein [Patescibacteria group bacterium]
MATTKYGAGAYTGRNPIGGGSSYVSRYKQSDAKWVVYTLAELTARLEESFAGDIIWQADGTVFNVTEPYAKMVKSRVVLGANRGKSRIKDSYNVGGYMVPLFYSGAKAVFTGLTLEGPQALSSTSGSGRCAIRTNGSKGVECENLEVYNFACGGIWFGDGAANISPWNGADRNWVHHSYIHNIQRHGFGYGIGQQGAGQSFLAEANIVEACRHLIMGQAGSDSYEVRFNKFGEAFYNTRADGTGTWYQSHQVDCHGGESNPSPSAGVHLIIENNDFSLNNRYQAKPNVAIRGIPASECRIKNNWSQKTHGGQSGVFTLVYSDEAFQMWAGATGTLASYHVTASDNWYGTTPPPDDTPGTPDIKVTGMTAAPNPAMVGQNITVTVKVLNQGTAAGSETVDLGGVEVEAQTVEIDAGESMDVVFVISGLEAGTHTITCSGFSVDVVVASSSQADIQVIKLEAPQVVLGETYKVTATAENKGDAAGSKNVVIYWVPGSGSPVEMESKTVTLGPGGTDTVIQEAKSTAVGDWTFKAGDLTVVLQVLAQGAARFEMSDIAAGAVGSDVSLAATIKNVGNAKGTATVTLSGDADGSKAVTLEAGASQRVSFSITMSAK